MRKYKENVTECGNMKRIKERGNKREWKRTRKYEGLGEIWVNKEAWRN